MKTIIAGSRNIEDRQLVERAITESGFEITEVVCGEAAGVDRLGKEWAQENGIPVASFPADWKTHGKFAGFIRNGKMAEYAEALIAVWDGKSKGTSNMIKVAAEYKLSVYVCKT